jgi:hypothetical protein
MLIAEKYILILLQEEKNKIPWLGAYMNPKSFAMTIATSILMDLVLQKKIIIEVVGKKKAFIKINDATPLEDRFLDQYFTTIKNYKKKKNFRKVVAKLGHFNSASKRIALINAFFERLDQQGIIRFEKRMKKMMVHSGRQVLIKPEVKRDILNEINDVVFNNKEPTESTLCFLSLLNTRNDFFIFSKDLRKQAKERISELVKSSVFTETLKLLNFIILQQFLYL